MRYTKGRTIEVFCKSEVPSGSWRCAEIICGNGHEYTIRYKMDHGANNEAIVERVSRSSIRPCPPLVELPGNWLPGDIVEVFHNFSWKMAIVSEVLDPNHFLVRLLGFLHEFDVSTFHLRVRQSWQDNKWFVIGKSARYCEDPKNGELSTLKYNQRLSSLVKKTDSAAVFNKKDECFAVRNNNNFQKPQIVSSRTLKRGLPSCYTHDATPRTVEKFRVIVKESGRHRLGAANPSPLPEKVEAVGCYQDVLVEKYKNVSLNNITTHFDEVDVARWKPSGAVGGTNVMNLEPNDADNISCSVGSCSVTSNDSFKVRCNFARGVVEDIEGNSSDAESVYHWGFREENCFHPTQEELAAEIHRLELQAYRCTIEALHASGPLSWEQETLVTNLRLSLHISNDEHLIEIKNLTSTATSVPLS